MWPAPAAQRFLPTIKYSDCPSRFTVFTDEPVHFPALDQPLVWDPKPFSESSAHEHNIIITYDASPIQQNVAEFLQQVYVMAEAMPVEDVIDFIFLRINELLMKGEFLQCNQILATIDPDRTSEAIMVAILTITASASAKLPARHSFYEFVRQRIASEQGADEAESLLVGLE